MSDKPFIIVNPMAANGRVGRDWAELKQVIEREVGAFDFAVTEHGTHATELATEALKAGHRTIGSLGGDGTHSTVVRGFFEGREAIAPDAELAILPFGTGGDFARMLPIDRHDFRAWVRQMVHGPSTPIDVGHLEYEAFDGAPGELVFLNIASWGLSGLVDRYVNETTKIFGGKVSYLLATVRALFRFDPAVVHLTVDGEPLDPAVLFVGAACNGRYFGGGMKFGPDADLCDGQLDLVTMPWRSKRFHLTRGLEVYKGTHTERPDVKVMRFKELRATADRECWIDVDGEGPGRLPLTVRVLPGSLRLRGLPAA